ncbi:hypothetical protein H2199_007851 [Coniosporium tulheliwenetii]|uniref:Uncharacterized protein n=1 Tax=Coniosporium tulheliwenetii TaxID=3383036 RepID=A0ACC2YNL1_9PEZI|nr:hypothetical protein H2199_007851 [Cladosporium sp. JES 115]
MKIVGLHMDLDGETGNVTPAIRAVRVRSRYVEAERQAEMASLAPSPASPSTCGLDQLGPAEVSLLINDWFERIHSVAPILHRASFLRRLAAGDATRDREFCNLVVSICAATVASLKRKSSTYCGTVTVERCLELAERNDTSRPKNGLTLEFCQTKYNFSIALGSERGLDDPNSSLLMAEALAGVKYLIYHQLDQMDFVKQQLLKRLYWLIFAAECTAGIHGRPYLGMLSPHDYVEALKPLEITDKELDPLNEAQLNNWHGDRTTYIPGLNHLTNVFMLWYKCQQETWHSLEGLQEYMTLANAALDYLPPELRWRGGLSRPPQSNFGTDVQTVNLYITQIHVRSSLLHQMDHLAHERGASATSAEITTERQRLVDDMLAIVYQMPEDTLEANGHSLIPKLRDIGLALLHEDADPANALVNLDRLLKKLDRLDYRPEGQFGQTSPASV